MVCRRHLQVITSVGAVLGSFSSCEAAARYPVWTDIAPCRDLMHRLSDLHEAGLAQMFTYVEHSATQIFRSRNISGNFSITGLLTANPSCQSLSPLFAHERILHCRVCSSKLSGHLLPSSRNQQQFQMRKQDRPRPSRLRVPHLACLRPGSGEFAGLAPPRAAGTANDTLGRSGVDIGVLLVAQL